HGELRNAVLRLQLPHERDGLAVHCRDVIAGVAEERAPVAARAPGRALEDEARPVGASDGNVLLEIADEGGATLLRFHQVEGGEIGQVNALVENQRRFYPAVSEEQAAIELRQAVLGQTH